MAVEQVQAFVFKCDGCEKNVLAQDADKVPGYTGVLTEVTDDGARDLRFFACRKTHVAKAVKSVLTAAETAPTDVASVEAPDPTSETPGEETPDDRLERAFSAEETVGEGATSGATSPGSDVTPDGSADNVKAPRQRGRR